MDKQAFNTMTRLLLELFTLNKGIP